MIDMTCRISSPVPAAGPRLSMADPDIVNPPPYMNLIPSPLVHSLSSAAMQSDTSVQYAPSSPLCIHHSIHTITHTHSEYTVCVLPQLSRSPSHNTHHHTSLFTFTPVRQCSASHNDRGCTKGLFTISTIHSGDGTAPYLIVRYSPN